MSQPLPRRQFLGRTALAGAALSFGLGRSQGQTSAAAKAALLGGPASFTGKFPTWPVFDDKDEAALLRVLRSGKWGRGSGQSVAEFEKAFAALAGAKHCVATSSGTSGLITSLAALDVGPGDEVILSPYTFVATYNAIAFHFALPVFVDTDAETFQMDAKQVGAALTDQTKAILPAHIGGATCDLDLLQQTAAARKIPVLEDACQAHLSEWRGKMVGNLGHAGVFSFQASKNLTSGEGGAILTNDAVFADRCYNFQNQGRGRTVEGQNYSGFRGANLRLSEFQGGLLLAQMARLQEQAKTRDENAAELTRLLREIPGIQPSRKLEGNTRCSYHLYMFRYQKEHFAGLSRDKFKAALAKEGIPCTSGYAPLNRDAYVLGLAQNPHYRKIYGADTLARWQERNQCPVNDKLCQEAVWFTQNLLLGTKNDMEQIAVALRKIQAQAGDIAKH